MEIEYSSHFTMAYERLSLRVQRFAEKKELIFKDNPFDLRLKTHKLHGKLKSFYSFSINSKIRIVFKFINREKVVFLDVGDHNIYR